MKEMIRVLIADDSVAFGKACQKELKSGGFDCVLTQKDGNRVISLLDTQHFDVVVMDVFMSGADAWKCWNTWTHGRETAGAAVVLYGHAGV